MTKNVNVRFDEGVHARLVVAAKRNRRSLNAQVETYCETGLNGDGIGIAGTWTCDECGWEWPLSGTPRNGSECDNCGGELVPTAEPAREPS